MRTNGKRKGKTENGDESLEGRRIEDGKKGRSKRKVKGGRSDDDRK